MRSFINSFVVLFVFVVVLEGCAPMTTTRYTPYGKNVKTLREIAIKTSNKVAVGNFSGGPKSVSCRSQGLSPSDNKTFSVLIRDALVDELIFANLYSEKSDIKIEAIVDDVDVDCASGNWHIKIKVSSGGRDFVAENTYDFESAFVGMVVFNNAQQALIPAIQDIIGVIVNNPDFQSIVLNKS